MRVVYVYALVSFLFLASLLIRTESPEVQDLTGLILISFIRFHFSFYCPKKHGTDKVFVILKLTEYQNVIQKF